MTWITGGGDLGNKKIAPAEAGAIVRDEGLEGDLALDLDDAWRSVAAQERSEHAGRWANGMGDQAKGRASQVLIGLIEVRMIEQVEELHAHTEHAGFGDRNVEVLHGS